MSLGSGFLENIPHFTFTPSEHQVECVRVAGYKNVTYVLPQQHEKSFLALMAIKERSNYIRAGLGKALVLLYKKSQVSLWGNFLSRMTDLKVEEIKEEVDLDTGQLLSRLETGGVLVGTHSVFSSLLSKKLISLSSFNLIIIDNIQASLGTRDLDILLQSYRNIPRNRAPRLISFTPNILNSNPPHLQFRVPMQLCRLEQLLPASVECSCEVATQLRFLARPREIIVMHRSNHADPSFAPEEVVRNILIEIKDWIEDQNYSLYDTYGEEFQDLIADIPDPAFTPLNIIQEFISVLDNLGLWCADRAALVLLIKIDKLKTREKYERHFLLLSVLFTAMVKIRKICDDFFGHMDDYDRIIEFSKPKLIKLIQLLKNYEPKGKVKPVENSSSPDKPEPERLGPEDSKHQILQPASGEKIHGEIEERREGVVTTGVISEPESSSDCFPSSGDTKSAEPLNGASKTKPEPSIQAKGRGPGRKGMRRTGPAPEDPEALCSLLIVNSTFHAKILYHYLKYSVSDPVSSDPRDTENEKKKQEEALRRFRMRESNILVSSSVLGIETVSFTLNPNFPFHILVCLPTAQDLDNFINTVLSYLI